MDSDDFTFCQVGVPVKDDDIDEKKILRGIGSIAIKDEFSNSPSGNDSSGNLQEANAPSRAPSMKEATVGSLSFTVVDTSPQKTPGENPKKVSSGSTETSFKVSQEQRAVARKPAPRAKVPFEKGYSQMDWMKLTRTHPDLAGLKGQSNRRLISMDEVKQHQREDSMWTVLKGRVYNLSPYMKFHPGGVDMLMKAVGKDCTSLFNKYHAWVNAEFLLEKCLVGTLDADGH